MRPGSGNGSGDDRGCPFEAANGKLYPVSMWTFFFVFFFFLLLLLLLLGAPAVVAMAASRAGRRRLERRWGCVEVQRARQRERQVRTLLVRGRSRSASLAMTVGHRPTQLTVGNRKAPRCAEHTVGLPSHKEHAIENRPG